MKHIAVHQNKPTAGSAFRHAAAMKKQPFIDLYKVLHIVQANDSFSSIAEKYHVTAEAIKEWNRIAAKDALQKNQQLIIWKKHT